ncbi:hypothetical protein BDP27DRAFT_1434253 [Rhodocollybia butyracea]|uniref:Uncharacterized protein n=1 Tax=Rhodocollybia butyracea TaxID=206335 RepID=A0A9P5P8F8_9AGAR|nr:hypothetical protein BDP27DRAFT_1434253 [Rhodocollybia butyracea]
MSEDPEELEYDSELVYDPPVTIITPIHSYPAQEIWALEGFYGGVKCPITQREYSSVEWGHILDTALEGSQARLKWMLDRKLRIERHPAHAAEVRENIVPLSILLHHNMNFKPARFTLVPHEDVLARTLAYELDVQAWRRKEVFEGRGDPGRPEYHKDIPYVQTLP